MESDLEKVRIKYGKEMADFCEQYLPTISQSSRLFEILEKNFSYSKRLFKDIMSNGLYNKFREYLNGIYLNVSKEELVIPSYIKDKNGKYHYYTFSCNDIYYCPYNKVIDHGEAKGFNPEKYLMFKCYIIDLEKKIIYLYDKTITDQSITYLDRALVEKIVDLGNEKNIYTKDYGTLIISREGELKDNNLTLKK